MVRRVLPGGADDSALQVGAFDTATPSAARRSAGRAAALINACSARNMSGSRTLTVEAVGIEFETAPRPTPTRSVASRRSLRSVSIRPASSRNLTESKDAPRTERAAHGRHMAAAAENRRRGGGSSRFLFLRGNHFGNHPAARIIARYLALNWREARMIINTEKDGGL